MRLKIFFVFALFLTGAFSLRAEERILNFDSDIKINTDASLDVAETIKVVCEGNRIRHGIYRDFPTRCRDHFGNNYKVDFNVVSVLRDGVYENFHVDNTLTGKRVYIGSKNRLLENGKYAYSLVYHTTRQLGFFKDKDELYWNVTGNDWEFAIDKAKALVHLPPGASLLSRGAYTGVTGSREQDFIVKQQDDAIVFETSRPLYHNEGLTIYVDWPKGFVKEPAAQDKFFDLLKDNVNALAGLIGISALFFYYLYAWFKVGKDPARGTIISLYEPPEGFSPAACRYLLKMDYDNKDFACALVDMAVKGYLTIEEDKGGYILKKTGAGMENLSGDETAIANNLLLLSDTIALKQENHERISEAIAAFNYALSRGIEKIYFLNNAGYVAFGLILSVFVFVAQVVLTPGLNNAIAILVLFLAVAMDIVFYRLLKAPTMLGRIMLDKIAGFKLYIGTAEKDTIAYEVKNISPQLFEKYLPYAMALNVEKTWSNKFAAALKAAEAKGYVPIWYSGHDFSAAAFTTSFASALAASAASPGSSSGFGGSSGGGGGGGGGGW